MGKIINDKENGFVMYTISHESEKKDLLLRDASAGIAGTDVFHYITFCSDL